MAMTERAADVRWVSGERAGTEVRRIAGTARPSAALRLLMDAGVLAALIPELAPQRGMPQGKATGADLWEHTLLTADAAARLAPGDARLVMAALLHDVGKPSTATDGHFHGHAAEGARLAAAILGRLRWPAREIGVIRRLVEEHMFQYLPEWSDAAVRRFIRRIGPDSVPELLRLREADNLGSGLPAGAGAVEELRDRIEGQLAASPPLSLADLAVDGDDLLAALGRPPGPWLGALLARLLESVIADPSRNTPAQLLADARAWAADDSDQGRPGGPV
jgi:tRNA nucleotidyltransferase/poly(A) polymerase